jgi:hypothetical protein
MKHLMYFATMQGEYTTFDHLQKNIKHSLIIHARENSSGLPIRLQSMGRSDTSVSSSYGSTRVFLTWQHCDLFIASGDEIESTGMPSINRWHFRALKSESVDENLEIFKSGQKVRISNS